MLNFSKSRHGECVENKDLKRSFQTVFQFAFLLVNIVSREQDKETILFRKSLSLNALFCLRQMFATATIPISQGNATNL